MNALSIPPSSLDKIPPVQWEKLSQKKLFFGHQSVGGDIINGVHDIMNQSAYIKLSIRHTRESKDFTEPVFAEFSIGRNGDPKSKIDDFRTIIEAGAGATVNIALFKLCFIDINTQTDVADLFSYYTTTMAGLASKFSDVHFVHCTVPLTVLDSGIKGAIKRLLGRESRANLNREAYNRMVRATYGARGTVFDIASYESTFPDKTRMIRRMSGQDCPGLVPAYSNDGGHLNQTGRIIVARGLLELLLAVP